MAFGDGYYLDEVVVETEAADDPDGHGLALGDFADDGPNQTQKYEYCKKCDGEVVGPVHLWFIGRRVVELQSDEGSKAGIRGLLEGRVQFILEDGSVDIGGQVVVAGKRGTKSYILHSSCQFIDYPHREISILIFVMQTVVVVAEVVEEFAGVCVDQRR